MLYDKISLVVVDDHPKARKNIRNLLKSVDDMVIVGEASNGAQAIDLALSEKPDVMLLDVELPDLKGTAVMRHLNITLPDIKVLAISSYNDSQFILGMKENGASGYLIKEEIPFKLISAIRGIILKGRDWIGPQFSKKSRSSIFEQTLTSNEAKIMKHLLDDKSENKVNDLGMDEKQINKYLSLLMLKYQVKSLPDLKNIAQQLFPDSEK